RRFRRSDVPIPSGRLRARAPPAPGAKTRPGRNRSRRAAERRTPAAPESIRRGFGRASWLMLRWREFSDKGKFDTRASGECEFLEYRIYRELADRYRDKLRRARFAFGPFDVNLIGRKMRDGGLRALGRLGVTVDHHVANRRFRFFQ